MKLNLTESERLARLRLLRTESIGPATFAALLDRFGSAESAIEHWSTIARRHRKTRSLVLAPVSEMEKELAATADYGAQLLAFDEEAYPRALAQTEYPPPFLMVKGDVGLLAKNIIATVGSRNASAAGMRFARDISREIGEAGLSVVSGLARGIDTAAHKGSIETGTIAVLAGGIDVIYPPENARLHSEIAAKGLLVSEMKFGQQLTAQHFPRRNRIISGLALGVLVVEATLNSGSLITARLAGEQGRDVFAVPGSPLDPRSRGTNALLRQGAILTENADDITSALHLDVSAKRVSAPTRAQSPAPAQTAQNSEQLQAEILDRLSPTPVDLNDLVRLTGAPAAAISVALLDLEFAGLLTRHPGQKVSLASSS